MTTTEAWHSRLRAIATTWAVSGSPAPARATIRSTPGVTAFANSSPSDTHRQRAAKPLRRSVWFSTSASSSAVVTTMTEAFRG